jgi:hypothetical protein
VRPRSPAVRGSTLVALGLAALACACVLPAAAAGERTVRPDAAAVYGGVGSWLDIFARSAWSSPSRVVASLKAHGVSTLYLQTSNYSQPDDIVNPPAVGRFLDVAHAAGLHVAAWYLPSFADPALDRRRALAAIRYRSTTGQRFDSFALDIEASIVHPVALRNARLASLALALRRNAPTGYPLGAIIPSPVGMRRHPHYWPGFPYAPLAHVFDVFLPMAYFSYSAKTPSAAYAYARDVVVAIRQATGRPDEPIHVIGGIADRVRPGTFASFARALSDCGVNGASLYAFPETSAAEWSGLARVTLDAAPIPACSG